MCNTQPTNWRRRCAKTSAEYRSEEHTSELQSRGHLVCRLLLEKKKERIADGTESRRARARARTGPRTYCTCDGRYHNGHRTVARHRAARRTGRTTRKVHADTLS